MPWAVQQRVRKGLLTRTVLQRHVKWCWNTLVLAVRAGAEEDHASDTVEAAAAAVVEAAAEYYSVVWGGQVNKVWYD